MSHFCSKIFNAARFADGVAEVVPASAQPWLTADRGGCRRAAIEVNELLDAYDFSEATRLLTGSSGTNSATGMESRIRLYSEDEA
jgi:valyl-tRNA synthetase